MGINPGIGVRRPNVRPAREGPAHVATLPPRRSASGSATIKSRAQKLGATARSFAILDHVAASPGPVDVLDIIASLKLPKATAYRLVDWFVTRGYLAREPGRKRLIVGPRLTNLAFGVLSASMRNDAPHVVLQRLVRTLNETCNIGTLLNGEVVYLDRVEAEHWPLRLHYTSGSRVPLHCSAIGKLFLALAPAPRRQRLLQSLELRRFTDNTITDRTRTRGRTAANPQGPGFVRPRGISRRRGLHGGAGFGQKRRDARRTRDASTGSTHERANRARPSPRAAPRGKRDRRNLSGQVLKLTFNPFPHGSGKLPQ